VGGRERTKHKREVKIIDISTKCLLLLALISVVVALTIQPLSYWAYEEFYIKPFFSKHPLYKLWADPRPFSRTLYSTIPLIAYKGIGSLWIGIALLKLTSWIGKKKVQCQTNRANDTSIVGNRN
jgi:hypothetical protein